MAKPFDATTPELSNTVVKPTAKDGDELTGGELGEVAGGADLSATVKFKFTTTTKDKVDTF
jgi:hypothetical protein